MASRRETVNMDDAIVAKAYRNFVEVFYKITDHNNDPGYGLYFWKFLGMEISPALETGWEMPPEAARRCHLLATPHYRTVAKLMSLKGHRHDIQAEHRLWNTNTTGSE